MAERAHLAQRVGCSFASDLSLLVPHEPAAKVGPPLFAYLVAAQLCLLGCVRVARLQFLLRLSKEFAEPRQGNISRGITAHVPPPNTRALTRALTRKHAPARTHASATLQPQAEPSAHMHNASYVHGPKWDLSGKLVVRLEGMLG